MVIIKAYKQIYFASLISSIAIITFIKFSSRDPITDLIVSSFMLFWMIILGIITYIKNQREYDETDADLYYYYGFILTLTTLAATFLPFLFTNSDLKKEQILGGFGLGLFTTFIGLTGRILLYQQFEKLTTGSETVVQRISQIGNRFASDLGEITTSMNTSLDELKINTNALNSEIKSLTYTLESLRSSVSETLPLLTSATTTVHQKVDQAINASIASIDNVTKKLGIASNSISTFADTLSNVQFEPLIRSSSQAAQSLDVVNASSTSFTHALKDSSDILVKLSNQFNLTLDESINVLSQSSLRVNEIQSLFINRSLDLNDAYTKSSESIKALSNVTSQITNAFASIRSSVIETENSLSPLPGTLVSINNEMKNFSIVLTNVLNSSNSFSDILKSLNEKSSELIDVNQKIVNNLYTNSQHLLESDLPAKINSNFNLVNELLLSLQNSLSNTISEFQSYKTSYNDLASTQILSQQLISDTHRSLIDSISAVTKKLK